MNYKWLLVGCGISGLYFLVSCASDPAQSDPVLAERFEKVQVLNEHDGALSCSDLQAQVSSLEGSIAKMDHQSQYWKAKNRSDSQASALGAAVGSTYGAAGMQMASQTDAQNVADIESVEATYQKRHDYLLQIYLGKKCSPLPN